MKPIGRIKARKTVHCSICTSPYRRTSTAAIYSQTDQEINRAKEKVRESIQKPYTCNICKSILEAV